MKLDLPFEAHTKNILPVVVMAILAVLALSSIAIGWTAPTGTGGAGRPLYDLVVTDFAQGLPGLAAAVALLCFAAYLGSKNLLTAIPPILGAATIYKAEDLATGFGYILM